MIINNLFLICKPRGTNEILLYLTKTELREIISRIFLIFKISNSSHKQLSKNIIQLKNLFARNEVTTLRPRTTKKHGRFLIFKLKNN